jgi:hypothetical protein
MDLTLLFNICLYSEFENLPNPAWGSNMMMLTESDNEILIDEDEEGECLKQVVVHSTNAQHEKSGIVMGTAQGILDKVTGVLRKISTGTKNSSDGETRNVSRNESQRRYNQNTDS